MISPFEKNGGPFTLKKRDFELRRRQEGMSGSGGMTHKFIG
jgi:hypothetical protein